MTAQNVNQARLVQISKECESRSSHHRKHGWFRSSHANFDQRCPRLLNDVSYLRDQFSSHTFNSTSGVGPIRSRRRTMESEIHEKYRIIVEDYYSGTSISKAVAKVGMGRTSLYKWRYMAEMKIIDSSHYSYLQQQFPHATKLLVGHMIW